MKLDFDNLKIGDVFIDSTRRFIDRVEKFVNSDLPKLKMVTFRIFDTKLREQSLTNWTRYDLENVNFYRPAGVDRRWVIKNIFLVEEWPPK